MSSVCEAKQMTVITLQIPLSHSCVQLNNFDLVLILSIYSAPAMGIDPTWDKLIFDRTQGACTMHTQLTDPCHSLQQCQVAFY